MLTLFALPKAFSGHTGIIQRNALKSWIALGNNVEIILFGDDPGVAETAAEFEIRHVKDVKSSGHGTPLVDDIFTKADSLASYNIMCYVNSDIILTQEILQGAQACNQTFDKFLMVSQRWDLDVNEEINFNDPDWLMKLHSRVARFGNLHRQSGIDYFLYKKGMYSHMPPFAIGRLAWDNWIVREAKDTGCAVVDATEAVFIVHQNHDYNHAPGGHEEVWKGEEQKRNKELANMTWGGDGYIQNASTWRLLPWRFIPANKADLPGRDFDPEKFWIELVAKITPMIENQKFEQALAELDQSAEFVQHLEDYHYIRGIAYAHMGKKAKAINACRDAMRINPGSPHARELIETLGGDASTPWAEANRTEPVKEEIPKKKIEKVTSTVNCKQHSDFNDRNALFSEMVMLEKEDFRDKTILEIGSGKRENLPVFELAKKVLSIRPEGHKSNQDDLKTDNKKSILNCSIKEIGNSHKFDIVLLTDLQAFGNNPETLAEDISRLLINGGLLVLANTVKSRSNTFDIHLIKYFEPYFLIQLEQHFDIEGSGKQQSLKLFAYEKIQPERPVIVLAKLQRANKKEKIKDATAPYEVDGRIYAVDHEDLKPGLITKEIIVPEVDRSIKTIETDAPRGLNILKKQINKHYDQVRLRSS